ncbi:MAG: hypothetical protein ABWX73_14240 [Marmoricola sp.]
MSGSVPGDKAASWFASADPAGLLYGAIVSAAVLATISAHADGATFVGVATSLVLVVYWMAHVYINTLSRQFAGDTRHFLLRLRTSSAHETSVLKGGLPAIVVYVVASWAGLSISSAAALAVYFSVVLLGAVGYLGARQAGLRGRIVLLEVAGAASFGLLIVAAKTLLH